MRKRTNGRVPTGADVIPNLQAANDADRGRRSSENCENGQLGPVHAPAAAWGGEPAKFGVLATHGSIGHLIDWGIGIRNLL